MEIELYEGAIFVVPKTPPKDQILNYNLPKKDQKWRRTELPENWEEMSDVEQEKFAFEEDRKCKEGVFFYNNGIITYITGDHYHYLNWFKIDSGHPEYRDRDRRWFYHWWLCDHDKDCLGQCYGKLRRDGYSFRVDSIMLNRARKTFDSHYGMVSKTGDDAQEMFKKLVHGFLSYPSFFKPTVQSAEDVKKSLVFRTPQQRVTFKNRLTKKEISLNTTIDYKNTKENAYDGYKIKVLGADETGKWEEVNVQKWWNIAKTCITLGRRVIGKCLFGSTVNESKKGGAGFKAIWDESSYKSRVENNRTGSGLWRYFVAAYDGLEGFIDEYGQSVIDTPKEPIMGIDGEWISVGAKEFCENVRQNKINTGDVIGFFEEIRQRPFTEDEMFRDPANENTPFDLDKLYLHINHNESLPTNLLVRGNFAWENGVQDTKVVWHPTPQGRWLIYWMPLPEDRNKVAQKKGKKYPGNIHAGLFSTDPIDHSKPSSDAHSKAASHGIHKPSFSNPKMSNVPVSQYWGRPSDSSVYFEDMLMQCVFYGWQILGESNKPGCINHFYNRGYDEYLMDRPTFTHSEHSEKTHKEKNSRDNKWIPNTGTVDRGIRRMLVEHTASFIFKHIGFNSDTKTMGNFMFTDTLKDLVKFNIEEWGKYDLSVSFMFNVLGLGDYVPEKKPVITNAKFFETYNYNGNVGQVVFGGNKEKEQRGGGPIVQPMGKPQGHRLGDEVRKKWGL